jgi:L-threonylcarbamoyladenylate synthase
MKQTILLKVDSEKPDVEKIQIAAEVIQKGGLVAFPTETVYGLGADALNPEAVLALFEAKKRPLDNPPIIHIARAKEVYKLAQDVPKKAELLMKEFWPGPLTLVFKRSNIIPEVTVACLDTVAIRMPQHKVALSLIKQSGRSIAAPSANLAGKPSPTTATHVYEDLNGRIDVILDSGLTNIGLESTVLDMSVDPPMVLRPGGTTFEALKKVLGEVRLHPFVEAGSELPLEKIRSPGMKHRHYAPKAKVILVEGSVSAITGKIQRLVEVYELKGEKVGILATDETIRFYKADAAKSLGSRFNLPVVAQNLFRLLREVDAENVDVIIAEGVPLDGIGLAIMNRLRKASGYHIIQASQTEHDHSKN